MRRTDYDAASPSQQGLSTEVCANALRRVTHGGEGVMHAARDASNRARGSHYVWYRSGALWAVYVVCFISRIQRVFPRFFGQLAWTG